MGSRQRERQGSALRTVRWFDRRSPLMEAAKEALRKPFPDHWSFLLGELALYSFTVLVLTGVVMTMFFEPSNAESVYHGSYRPLDGIRMSEAYSSTVNLTRP